ncbi:MAG: winged helix-turn-helix transcriptional regulator [bacterium]
MGEGDQKSKGKVIRMIARNPSVTITEIAAALDMSIPGIEKIVRSLKKGSRLCRIGLDKGGYWEVSEED